jgi:rubrerythrin
MPSRREILGSFAAFAGAALLSACGGGGGADPDAETENEAQMRDDAAVLASLLDMEDSAVVSYGYLAERLDGAALRLARRFAAQEREHANVLRRTLVDLGHPAAPPKSAALYRAGLPQLRSADAALAFALDLEETAIGAYADAFAKVFTDPVRATLATIFATEAEQAAVWLGQLGRPQVPAAFVTGPPPELDDQ